MLVTANDGKVTADDGKVPHLLLLSPLNISQVHVLQDWRLEGEHATTSATPPYEVSPAPISDS